MAITRGNQMEEVPANNATSPYTTSATLAVNAGEAVLVLIRGGHTGSPAQHGTTAVSDSVAGAYTFVDQYETGTDDPDIYAYVYLNHPGGTVTFTETFSNGAGEWYVWIWAGAYAGVATSSAVDTSGTNVEFFTGSTTDLTTSAFTCDADDSLIVVATSTNAFIASYTAGTGFTLRNGALGGAPQGGNYGGVEDQILTGDWTSTQAHITAVATNTQWTIAHIVLKAAAAGGGVKNPPSLLLQGVQ